MKAGIGGLCERNVHPLHLVSLQPVRVRTSCMVSIDAKGQKITGQMSCRFAIFCELCGIVCEETKTFITIDVVVGRYAHVTRWLT